MKLRWVGNGYFCSVAYTHGDDKHFAAFNKQQIKQPNTQKKLGKKETKDKHTSPGYLWSQIEPLVSVPQMIKF